jgi:DNA-directed RNA polymerase subunit alpha
MFAVDKFNYKVVKDEKDFGEFVIGPLPRGFGETLSNALRRILLSSIEGAAVTSVKVDGVKHEYSTMPGVIDDVLTVLLRIKKLALKSHSDEPQELILDMKGKKQVTAKDIETTADVEISNPELELTELTDSKAKLKMTITVEKGQGYIPSDESKRGQLGVVPLDANFSPIKRVVVRISETRVGQQTNLDEVTLGIYSNGALSPKEALDQAVDIYFDLVKRLKLVVKGEVVEEEEEVAEKDEEDTDKISQSSDLDIDKLNLSARLSNALLKAGFKNLTELEGKSLDEIMEIQGLGQRSAEELFEIMKSYKLEVKE